MPVIQQQDPFSAALGTVAGYLAQKKQNANDAADRALKTRQVDAQIQDAAARRAQAELQMDLDRQGFQLKQRTAGINPATGQPFTFGYSEAELGSPKSSIEHKAAIADQMAASAAAQGAVVPSQRYTQIANALRLQAHQANADALAFRKEIDSEITNRAKREHWSQQDKLRARQIANTYEVGIRNGDIRLQAAQIAASAHLQGVGMQQAGAMQRAQYTQGQENRRYDARTAATAAAAVQRFNTQTKNDANKFNLLHPGSNYAPQTLGGSFTPPQGSISGTINGKRVWKYPDGSFHDYATGAPVTP